MKAFSPAKHENPVTCNNFTVYLAYINILLRNISYIELPSAYSNRSRSTQDLDLLTIIKLFIVIINLLYIGTNYMKTTSLMPEIKLRAKTNCVAGVVFNVELRKMR